MGKKEFEQLLEKFAPIAIEDPIRGTGKENRRQDANTHWTQRQRNYFIF
jgi:hypothetical protein